MREVRDNYEDLITNIMSQETSSAPIAYNLNERWVDYIAVLMQQIKGKIVADINEICRTYTLSNKMVEDVLLVSSLGESDE